ncbi:Pyruvate/Phosphoenolpyruvate kinase-like domain-containing protein [Penicillium taxi]|uniref:Pyruvate/Phosphoenolpyruvate kinase-like domain-containing protein n=1 Tax=Penicillium taxi TaxID=168475 RepID=UPI00254572CC|nr:Pyruvate/Phosphoenolpyruvate kinase-like domain-containing protein [Penicillium taxi]KAJ5894830.1 Pyruvate/Phosphoenolpyruvate kinase-like domain-containing protein [Penicillium taxi]
MTSLACTAYSIQNPFRTRTLSGEITPLMCIRYVANNEIAMMAKMAGFHGLFIDMEHSSLDMPAVSQLILACNYVGISPVVRSPSKSHWHISRILDAGASAVVIPHIETVQEVRDLVKYAKYTPLGIRGCTNQLAINNFQHVPTLIQNEVLNKESMLIPMIETTSAVELVEEILAIEGVDGVLVGSYDLCSDLGIPEQYDEPVYLDSVVKVIEAANKVGKPVGIGGLNSRMDLLERWFSMGAVWSLGAADGAILQNGMKQVAKKYVDINERVQKVRASAKE